MTRQVHAEVLLFWPPDITIPDNRFARLNGFSVRRAGMLNMGTLYQEIKA